MSKFVTREGQHLAVGREKPLDLNFSPSHKLKKENKMSLNKVEKDQFIDLLCNMSLLDMSEIKARVEDELGLEFYVFHKRQNPAMTEFPEDWGSTRPDSLDIEPVYDVFLAQVGDRKISVIKVIREQLNCGLKQSKAFTDEAPCVLEKGLTEARALEMKLALENAGAKVIIEPRTD